MDKTKKMHKNVITNIRQEYGIRKDGSQNKAFRRISRSLKNSIEQLSTGLYEKEVHFILELIQNAEDNKYQNEAPELRYVVLDEDPTNTPDSDGCLCIFNNETGFEEKHVESICQIGESTKEKTQGYIGEKGIGFKSVFIVSSAPHIYSNAYCFQFKEKDPDIEFSYIVPYWLDNVPDIVKKDKANTAILLPLKSGIKKDIVAELKKIKPETILFLSKLEGLSVEINNESIAIDLIRDKTHAPIIDLLIQQKGEETKINHYWLHTNKVIVPNDIKEEKRQGVTDRNITIAFPMDNNNYTGTIYAFLPTEVDSGLPFLINADFILTANRESIQSDRKWNKWLRDALADLVVQGLESLSKNKEHRKSLYSFIPLTDEIKSLKDYFEPICKEVHSRLSSMNIVLSDEDILIEPSHARLAPKLTRQIFGGDSRSTAFNDFKFVDVELEKHSKRLKKIGVNAFDTNNLKQCLSDKQWLSEKNSEWFFNLYSFLRDPVTNFKKELKNLPIIPTQNGKLVSSDQQQIYFPANHNLVNKLDKRLSTENPLKIAFIDEQLSHNLSKNAELLAWVRENLHITDFSSSAYIGKTLVPRLYENVDQIKENDLLVAVQLILEYWKEITEEDRDIIGKKLPLLLDNGSIVNSDVLKGSELLTPRNFDKDKGWQIILKTEEDYGHQDILSNNYLNLIEEDLDRLSEFLNTINAQRYPGFREYTIRGTDDYENKFCSEYVNNTFKLFNQDTTAAPSIKTWLTPTFFHNESPRKKKKNRAALICWLEGMREKRSDKIRSGEIKWFYYFSRQQTVTSGLYHYLIDTPWINTTKGLKKPREVFTKTDQLFEMFGNRLAYLKDNISPELCSFLGIKTEVTTETVLEYLYGLSKQKEVDIKLVKQLYKYIDDYGDEYNVAAPFNKKTLIYIPESEKHWYKSNEVIWDDASLVLNNMYGWISPIYTTSNLREFFLEKVGVSETVQDKDLARAWLQLQTHKHLKPKSIEDSLSKIYPRMLFKAKQSNEHPEWWNEFIDEAMLWTRDDVFHDKNTVYVPDDLILSNLFKDELCFTWRPESLTHNNLRVLYKALDVSLLSENVTISLENTCEAVTTESPIFLTPYSKRLLCYMIYNKSPEKYEELISSGVLNKLLHSIEAETDSLTIKYEITGSGADKTVSDYTVYWEPASHLLYLCRETDSDDLLDDAVEVIARALWGSDYKRYEDNIRTTLSITKEDRYKKIRDKKGWHLPPEILKEINQTIKQSGQTISDVQDESPIEDNIPDESIEDENKDLSNSSIPTSTQPNQTHPGAGRPRNTSHQPTQSGVRTGSGNSAARIREASTAGNSSRIRGSRSRSRSTANSVNQARRNQMRSYVANELSDNLDKEANKQAQEARRKLGEQGEIEVMEDLRAKGYKVTRMPDFNKGYDLEAINVETSEILYIEVKGDSYDWTEKGVGLTPSQYKFGLKKCSSFYLAVVENLRTSPRNIYYIQDPVNKITQYRFDEGWKNISAPIKAIDSDQLNTNKSTIEQLIELTDSDKCKEIIEYCHENSYPYPDIGIELVDNNGKVVFEDIELAWEQEYIGVVLSEEDMDKTKLIDEQWLFYFIDDVTDILSILDILFSEDNKCEL